nr:DUF5919 domain-containing protein [Dactylosporangium thailandense]
MRHPLTRALASAGLTAQDVATHLQVDPKTVDRWFAGRVPYPRHRNELARLTGWKPAELWPTTAEREPQPAVNEIVATYANRSLVPAETWRSLFRNAEHVIDIVAYSALFLLEDPGIIRALTGRAAAGIPIRIALGDPNARQVAQRGSDENIGGVMAARIRNALILIEPIRHLSSLQLRLHDTVLYDSIYRGDDDYFVNIHVHATPASRAPVMHLRKCADETSSTRLYQAAISHVWASARNYAD